MPYNEAEFRGTDNLWVARVTKDDDTGYTFGTVVNLAPTGQISKTVNSSSETHYYSNIGMITIVTKGSDTVTITVPVLSLAKLGLLTGQTVDPTGLSLVRGPSFAHPDIFKLNAASHPLFPRCRRALAQ